MDPITNIGQPAPHFSLPDLQGRTYTLSQYQGRIVILNFWSAECPWSERTDEVLLRVLQAWDDRVVLLPIAANANESPDLLANVARSRGLPLVLHDPDGQAVDLYQAITTPHLFVADAQGILRYQGAFDDVTFRNRTPGQIYLIEAVDALLDGKIPRITSTSPYGCSIMRHVLD
jgi:peroxiredoxin